MLPHNLPVKVMEVIQMAGAGVKGSHRILTNEEPFAGSENEFACYIETYTDGAKFEVLKESGTDVEEIRLNAGSDGGYPERAFIPGRFTHIIPAEGSIVAVCVIKIM
jgi:hypothetical protein